MIRPGRVSRAASTLFPSESQLVRKVLKKLQRVQGILGRHDLATERVDVRKCFELLERVKDALGNSNNDVSYVATLLAKEYLARRHRGCVFDASIKSQSASGLDIDVMVNGRRIVGEVKTVYPYNETDFGAAQLDSFRIDFAKLEAARAGVRYLFVTAPQTFDVLRKKYRSRLRDVRVVSLLDEREFRG